MEARDVITQLEQGYRMPEPADCPDGFYQVGFGMDQHHTRKVWV
jgi:hypothetical protein